MADAEVADPIDEGAVFPARAPYSRLPVLGPAVEAGLVALGVARLRAERSHTVVMSGVLVEERQASSASSFESP